MSDSSSMRQYRRQAIKKCRQWANEIIEMRKNPPSHLEDYEVNLRCHNLGVFAISAAALRPLTYDVAYISVTDLNDPWWVQSGREYRLADKPMDL